MFVRINICSNRCFLQLTIVRIILWLLYEETEPEWGWTHLEDRRNFLGCSKRRSCSSHFVSSWTARSFASKWQGIEDTRFGPPTLPKPIPENLWSAKLETRILSCHFAIPPLAPSVPLRNEKIQLWKNHRVRLWMLMKRWSLRCERSLQSLWSSTWTRLFRSPWCNCTIPGSRATRASQLTTLWITWMKKNGLIFQSKGKQKCYKTIFSIVIVPKLSNYRLL